MKLSSLYLEAFMAVAQTQNFTKAAEKLHITQSALSQRIRNLESDLEIAVFIRDRAGVRLTEQGEELLRYCQTQEALELECLGRLSSGVRAGKSGQASAKLAGVIRIGGFSSVMRSIILPALAPLLQENEELKLHFLTREVRDLPQLLRQGAIDFLILDRDLQRDDLESVVIKTERNVLVEKKGYKGRDIYLDHDEEDQTTIQYLRQYKIKPTRLERRYLDDVYDLVEAVRTGLGRAVLPLHLIQDDSSLKIIQPSRILEVPIVLQYYKQAYYTKLHSAVVQALCKNNKS